MSTWTPYPCGDCGAAPDEPCADDCPSAAVEYAEQIEAEIDEAEYVHRMDLRANGWAA